jgi:transcriptional regulator with XRE-family HTH domain
MSDMAEKTDTFRQNVRTHLSDRGITQGELARRTGLSQAWLSEMLNGKANPSLLTCEKIAQALATPLEGLIATPPTPAAS